MLPAVLERRIWQPAIFHEAMREEFMKTVCMDYGITQTFQFLFFSHIEALANVNPRKIR